MSTSRTAVSASAASSSETAAARPRKPFRAPAWAQEAVTPVVILVVLFAVWEASVHAFSVPRFILPAPSAIWTAATDNSAVLAGHTMATGRTVLLGFGASILLSFPIAVAITASRTMANAIYPMLVLTQSIPKVALAPILVVILGANELPRVVITFLVAFFPLVLATATGLKAAPAELIELGRACRASRWKELWRIRLPYAVPFIFSGLKAAITLSVVGAVVAEFVNADRGLGFLIVTATAFFQVPLAWAALMVLALFGIVLFQTVALIERVFFPWAAQEQRQ